MNIDAIGDFVRALDFRHAVWLFPCATALHFLEEAPRFATWAHRYAAPKYTRAHWAKVHSVGLAYATVFSTVVSAFPNRWTVFLFFALCLTESVLNTLFHAGTTAAYGVYSPGLISSLVIYVPLYWYLTGLAYREHLLTGAAGLIAATMAVPAHTLDVLKTVYFLDAHSSARWVQRRLSVVRHFYCTWRRCDKKSCSGL